MTCCCGQEEDARELVDAMVEHSALESLVQRLSSFNESVDEEATAVTNTLSIFENMIELTPGVRCTSACCCCKMHSTRTSMHHFYLQLSHFAYGCGLGCR